MEPVFRFLEINDMTFSNNGVRNPWLDYLKAFAIYLVIVGHTISNCIPEGADTKVNGVIYFVHIPLFLVVSGLLVKDKSMDRYFWLNLLSRFVIPYTVWTVILTTFYMGKSHLLNDGLLVNVGVYVANWCHSFLWFVKAYLVVYILWQVLQRMSNLWRGIAGTAILVCINLLVVKNKPLAEMASLSLYSYTLFSAGAFLRRYLGKISFRSIVAFCLVFMLCLPFATHQNNYFECSFGHMFQYGNWYVFFLRFVAGICVSAALIGIGYSKALPPHRFLLKIGRQTFQIYLLQSLVVEAMLGRFLHVDNNLGGMLLVWLIALVITLICSFLVSCTSKIRILNFLLWGTK